MMLAQPDTAPDTYYDGDADLLFIGIASDALHRRLMAWRDAVPDLHDFLPDFHRLQLEHWLWRKCKALPEGTRVLDIGAQIPRRWVGSGYCTFGNSEDVEEQDITGNLTELAHITTGWEVILCTEVLEHCADPFEAVRQMRAAMVPGGVLLASAPFLWPDHRTAHYPDYWRFTEQGWRLLLTPFRDVSVTPCVWTTEGGNLLDLARRFEGWGWRHLVSGTSGFLVEARA